MKKIYQANRKNITYSYKIKSSLFWKEYNLNPTSNQVTKDATRERGITSQLNLQRVATQ